MTNESTCRICPPPLSGSCSTDSHSACPCTAGCRDERTAAFLSAWRAFADALTPSADQAHALLPGFTIDDPLQFVPGYKQGIRAKCDEIETADYLLLDYSGSVGSPIGFGEGIHAGENACLEAFNHLVNPPGKAALAACFPYAAV